MFANPGDSAFSVSAPQSYLHRTFSFWLADDDLCVGGNIFAKYVSSRETFHTISGPPSNRLPDDVWFVRGIVSLIVLGAFER